MKIIFGCSNCSQRKFEELERKYDIQTSRAIQKYNLLLNRGFAANGARVSVISGLPINRSVTSKKLIREKDDRELNVRYHYITTLNLPGFRQLMIFFGAFFGVLRQKKERQTFAVFDCLNIACALGMVLGCKIRGIKTTAIVTDLPEMEYSNPLLIKINNSLINRADSLIMLTEQMNERVNKKNRPHIVLEGHVDSEAPVPEDQLKYEEINGKRVILYAGNIKKIYGIQNLVNGFLLANIEDSELRIYGNGDFRQELEALCECNSGLKYLGVADNAEIVRQEQKSSLLVNPRPTAPEYTKYSFPSKNMEYMVSGTPLLTTVLPGMPREYCPYVFLLEDESAEGISDALKSFFELDLDVRKAKGKSARDFVINNKSNIVQAKKIIDFLTEMSKVNDRSEDKRKNQKN